MTQLALFESPPADVAALWYQVQPDTKWRGLRVDSFDGRSAVVIPVNFVDEAWPWTGRKLSLDDLRAEWKPYVAPGTSGRGRG